MDISGSAMRVNVPLLKQVLLADMPADLASKNLAEGIWKGLSLRVQGAAIATAITATAAVSHLLPGKFFYCTS